MRHPVGDVPQGRHRSHAVVGAGDGEDRSRDAGQLPSQVVVGERLAPGGVGRVVGIGQVRQQCGDAHRVAVGEAGSEPATRSARHEPGGARGAHQRGPLGPRRRRPDAGAGAEHRHGPDPVGGAQRHLERHRPADGVARDMARPAEAGRVEGGQDRFGQVGEAEPGGGSRSPVTWQLPAHDPEGVGQQPGGRPPEGPHPGAE